LRSSIVENQRSVAMLRRPSNSVSSRTKRSSVVVGAMTRSLLTPYHAGASLLAFVSIDPARKLADAGQ
jgi:hypothetical protein